MMNDRCALCGIEESRPETNQPAGWNREIHESVVVVRRHLDELPATSADQFHDWPKLFVRHFDDKALKWLLCHAILLVQHDVRFADRQLVPFAAHRLNQ